MTNDLTGLVPEDATHRYDDFNGAGTFLKEWSDPNKDGSYILARVWSHNQKGWRKREEHIIPKRASPIGDDA